MFTFSTALNWFMTLSCCCFILALWSSMHNQNHNGRHLMSAFKSYHLDLETLIFGRLQPEAGKPGQGNGLFWSIISWDSSSSSTNGSTLLRRQFRATFWAQVIIRRAWASLFCQSSSSPFFWAACRGLRTTSERWLSRWPLCQPWLGRWTTPAHQVNWHWGVWWVEVGGVDVVDGGDRVLRQTFRGHCANSGWGGEQHQLIRWGLTLVMVVMVH